MKKIWNSFLFLFLLVGCQSTNSNIKDLNRPPPPPKLKPPSPPPNFIPSPKGLAEIQINPIPHPFSLNGEIPFVIWVDGKKVNLTNKEVINIVDSLGIEYKNPIKTAEIYNGAGWQYPLKLKD